MMSLTEIKRRDRWADLAVFAVVVLALLLGVWLRDAALFRTRSFSVSDAGIAGEYPAMWLHEFGTEPLLRLRDPLGGAFDTRLELRSRPLADDVVPTLVLDALSLERAAEVEIYSTLRTEEVLLDGVVAVQRSFVYVQVDQNPYLDRLPVTVKGVDLVLRDGGRVVVVTYLAEADMFDRYYAYFRVFVEALDF